MRKYLINAFIIFLFLCGQINAQNQIQSGGVEIPYPYIPRVSAYEVYLKYKEGKAIILHGGGLHYSKRHILGAFNMDVSDELKDERLQKFKFPKVGIEIFTYCYWRGETGSASVAQYMIEKGYKNVKVVKSKLEADGAGVEMEKYFEYFIEFYGGAKIINPLTGNVTIIKR